MNFPLMDYMELTDFEPKAILGYRPVKWVNIYSDIESFREYRQGGGCQRWSGLFGQFPAVYK
jgi:hypothetical protein